MKRAHLQAQHQLEMAFVGEPDAGAADGALGLVLAAHAGVEQRQLGHTFCGELHDLDRQHAAQRQAGEGELSGRHLVDAPSAPHFPSCPRSTSGAWRQSGTTISASPARAATWPAYSRGEHSMPGTSSRGVLAIRFLPSASVA